ncbi:MAG: transketolase family protein [Clostridia bacterium]
MRALRDAYGQALAELGERFQQVVVLDADVATSTRSVEFAKRWPDRFFNMGISEQNMVAVAAGMALGGKVPFVNGFSAFLIERAFNQIRQSIAYPNLSVKLCGSHAGLSSSEDGASHQMFIDICLVRALPNMTVVAPADDIELERALPVLALHQGPCYLRLGKIPVPRIYQEDYQFRLGKAVEMKEGADITILTYGTMVAESLEASVQLHEAGISAGVVNVHTLKPLDAAGIVDVCRRTGVVLTVEEHSIIGGLGSAVAELLAPYPDVRHRIIGLPDAFGKSGSASDLLHRFGLTRDRIAREARDLLGAR